MKNLFCSLMLAVCAALLFSSEKSIETLIREAEQGDAVMAVQVETEPTFSPGAPKELFRGDYVTTYRETPEWDISPDGKRFLMIKSLASASDDRIIIVHNWFEELKRLAPVD